MILDEEIQLQEVKKTIHCADEDKAAGDDVDIFQELQEDLKIMAKTFYNDV